MSQASSLSVLIAAVAIGIAVWTQLIEGAPDRIDRSEEGDWLWVVASSSLYLGSFMLLGMLLGATVIVSIDLGGVAIGMYFVILALMFASFPTLYVIYRQMMEPFDQMNGLKEAFPGIGIIIVIISGAYILAQMGANLI